MWLSFCDVFRFLGILYRASILAILVISGVAQEFLQFFPINHSTATRWLSIPMYNPDQPSAYIHACTQALEPAKSEVTQYTEAPTRSQNRTGRRRLTLTISTIYTMLSP
jgi:hypothetical protein